MKTSYQSKFKSSVVIIVVIGLLSFLCKPAYEEIKVEYQGNKGQNITAVYHNPSDGKGTFSVTLTVPNGQSITLNQGESASGVRYTDDKTLVWWAKGDGAFMMEPDGKGDWEIIDTFKEVSIPRNR
ncbi:MliC family protein [Leptospira perdikensis]|uniref:Lysozyme inhibitor n=1 Tax=Leptospira perdikensis TaxID=2484948 RepID=A0A4R9JHL0_9LEPT|nr:MliC family protein [Leptospira perdikensis]TGL44363.1 lysozyme inhibitor [Leptospira perdikensis]